MATAAKLSRVQLTFEIFKCRRRNKSGATKKGPGDFRGFLVLLGSLAVSLVPDYNKCPLQVPVVTRQFATDGSCLKALGIR